MSQPPYPQQPDQQPPQQYPQQQYPPQQQYQQPYQHQPYQQQPPPQPKPKSSAGMIAAVIIIVIVVIIALIGFSYLFAGKATLKVSVNSTHILFSVNYELYIDGNLKKSGVLTPAQYVTFTFTVYPGTSCHTYNVFASSTGGGFGGQSDSENVRLCGGETESVSLYV